jgi:hypothetical protein
MAIPMSLDEARAQEHHCRKCGEYIEAADITGLVCAQCWIEQGDL